MLPPLFILNPSFGSSLNPAQKGCDKAPARQRRGRPARGPSRPRRRGVPRNPATAAVTVQASGPLRNLKGERSCGMCRPESLNPRVSEPRRWKEAADIGKRTKTVTPTCASGHQLGCNPPLTRLFNLHVLPLLLAAKIGGWTQHRWVLGISASPKLLAEPQQGGSVPPPERRPGEAASLRLGRRWRGLLGSDKSQSGQASWHLKLELERSWYSGVWI